MDASNYPAVVHVVRLPDNQVEVFSSDVAARAYALPVCMHHVNDGVAPLPVHRYFRTEAVSGRGRPKAG